MISLAAVDLSSINYYAIGAVFVIGLLLIGLNYVKGKYGDVVIGTDLNHDDKPDTVRDLADQLRDRLIELGLKKLAPGFSSSLLATSSSAKVSAATIVKQALDDDSVVASVFEAELKKRLATSKGLLAISDEVESAKKVLAAEQDRLKATPGMQGLKESPAG